MSNSRNDAIRGAARQMLIDRGIRDIRVPEHAEVTETADGVLFVAAVIQIEPSENHRGEEIVGCDIHLHIEVKVDGVWHHYSHPRMGRYYEIFEKMAGVRGDIENAIVAPRGLPEDISRITQLDANKWSYDGHSWSWLNAEEISELSDWVEKFRYPAPVSFGHDILEHDILNCYLFGDGFGSFHRYPESRKPFIQDLRFVFWFDC